MDSMSIGQLATAAGVNVETIRYYQRRGLIATPPKPLNGQRKYAADALRRINFIRRAQYLGFTLEEINGLLAVAASADCADASEFARMKLEELQQRGAELNRMRRELRDVVKHCDARKAKEPCPFIRRLFGDEGS